MGDTLTYAGVPLATPNRAMMAQLQLRRPLLDIPAFRYRDDDSNPLWAHQWEIPRFDFPAPALQIPTGAARWGSGLFFARKNKYDEILATVNNAGYGSEQDLVWDSQNVVLTTPMYILPSRTMYLGIDDIYLVTLVDARYFWRDRTHTITITNQTWSALIGEIATAVGVTITLDTIDSRYQSPSVRLSSTNRNIVDLLDACLTNIGHVLVRKLDGTFFTESAATAYASQKARYEAWQAYKIGGGPFLQETIA